jgi:hypothetical protein
MRALFLTLLLSSNIFFAPPTTVYICDSSNATRYHLNPKCRGLSNCSHKILTVTEEKAKAMHLTLCKWEK